MKSKYLAVAFLIGLGYGATTFAEEPASAQPSVTMKTEAKPIHKMAHEKTKADSNKKVVHHKVHNKKSKTGTNTSLKHSGVDKKSIHKVSTKKSKPAHEMEDKKAQQ
ncbi:hypothetical protein [Beggiatoa leptomitoformis]|uniref:Acid-shock protein n=1 Tax=Beggiatoa leptomitoformis TaxID=288004 RepID=A0A2N9YD36_9GAMM|nr:hypothetical protein [Beggiatoa leptomitoformis]ALG69202.1 hypothetical protein AL038_17820 [Beggiatoa leptomitoformis]AUI68367.1 hypothetical protein BLE401_06405 [Beggiatoa leptomitoformis]